jgi:hypothetical protein
MRIHSISRWLAAFALLCATQSTVLAAPAEISGIEKVYLRAGPGIETTPLGVLNAGDRVNVLEVQGSWTKVETREGTVGFVYHRYVVPLTDGKPTREPEEVAAPASNVSAEPTSEPVAAASDVTPAPAQTETITPSKDDLSAELASLRAEVADLKQKVHERVDQTSDVPPSSGGPASAIPAVNVPGAPMGASAREQGIGVLAVAMLSLLVGWILGSAFGRRRSRSQRPRLRL